MHGDSNSHTDYTQVSLVCPVSMTRPLLSLRIRGRRHAASGGVNESDPCLAIH